jgi:NADPH-dependent curcumin reductase CurA
MAAINRQLVLRARREGLPHAGDFGVRDAPIPKPGPGQFVVRNL